MNYSKIYDKLIQRGKNRVLSGYVERHHIIPRCMGGSDDVSNLVALTPEEHFVAHLLLLKIHKNSQYRFALAKSVQFLKQGKHSKKHGWFRREIAAAHSAHQSGKNNSQFGTMWVCNIDLKVNKKLPKGSILEPGWVAGRSKWKSKKRTNEHVAFVRSNDSLMKNFPNGFRWVTDERISKKIPIDAVVPTGYRYGKVKRS